MENREQQLARVSATYRRHGLVPGWERVWHEGRDITADPPRTWGWPYSDYVTGKRGEAIRQRYLDWYAEAVAERGDLI